MLCVLIRYILFIIYFNKVWCRTVFKEHIVPSTIELSFMKRYGYLPSTQGDDIDFVYTPQSISEAVSRLQYFAGITQTGELDEPTKKIFLKRRCGNKDILDSINRRKRYVIDQGWNKRIISYKVLNGASTLSKERVEYLMEKAFDMWTVQGVLTFVKQDDHADIKVRFTSGDHGDGFSFDGLGSVVAHTFPPPFGAMHFDDDEIWGENGSGEDEVTDFLAVAVHEIGHALGLSHSPTKSSVMYPYYQTPIEELGEDDINGLRELYLNKMTSGDSEETLSENVDVTESTAASHSSVVPRFTKALSEETAEDDIPDICGAYYDTIQVIQGKIFVFEEDWVWVMSNKKEMIDGYPKKFREVFSGLPESVTMIKAIYENRKGNIVIFGRRNYWEFNRSFQLIYSGNIMSFGIPEHVTELTTVFVSNYNNKTYLIADELFWRYDESTRQNDPGYPKSMGVWRNVSYPVNGGLIWEEGTYFFVGPRFWRFDHTLIAAHENYPVATAPVWFPCVAKPEDSMYYTYK